MNKPEAIALALLAALAAIFIWILYAINAQSHADGGTTVRGLILLCGAIVSFLSALALFNE